jgi:hypothetical protein
MTETKAQGQRRARQGAKPAGARAQPPANCPAEIWAGGQTGADRAALDFARAHGIPHGGWCPRGRKAEDGVIPACYRLTETASAAYEERTRLNVRDSDATVIFSPTPELAGGSQLTLETARLLGKPVLQLAAAWDAGNAAARLREFVRRHRVRRLNVAGPRASEAPGLAAFVGMVLRAAFAEPPAGH